MTLPGAGVRRLSRPRARSAVLVLLALLVAGCGGPAGDDGGERELTVLAAASLTESFQAIGAEFEREHPGVGVRFSFGSSSTLATQVNEGAPADVYASANQDTMQAVVDGGRAAGRPAVFATNTLQIAVAPGNPGRISGLADFADPERTVVLCAAQVPCGSAAARLFADAGITPAPDSYERDVKAALRKVETGEADAALVYATDVISAGDGVLGIRIDGVEQVPNRYPIVALDGADAPGLAADFIDFVGSPDGRQLLLDAGFGAP